jgi:hypothetical protein
MTFLPTPNNSGNTQNNRFATIIPVFSSAIVINSFILSMFASLLLWRTLYNVIFVYRPQISVPWLQQYIVALTIRSTLDVYFLPNLNIYKNEKTIKEIIEYIKSE